MPQVYPALPDHVIDYPNDGTRVQLVAGGTYEFTYEQLQELNDTDYDVVTGAGLSGAGGTVVIQFAEKKVVKGLLCHGGANLQLGRWVPIDVLYQDNSGGWVSHYANPSGVCGSQEAWDSWRRGAAQAVPPNSPGEGFVIFDAPTPATQGLKLTFSLPYALDRLTILHLYGHRDATDPADTLTWLDAGAGDVEFAAPIDFGNHPTGDPPDVHAVKIQNVSPDRTANTITIRSEHAAYTLSWDQVTWGSQLSIASLGPGVKSNVFYIRNSWPAAPYTLGPERSHVWAQAAAWT